MSRQFQERFWSLGLLVVAALLMSGSIVAQAASPRLTSQPATAVQNDMPSLSVATVGMGELMSQTFEFTGAFPAGWQTFAVTSVLSTANPGYYWATTTYTRFEGLRSAVAVGLTETASYTDAVDAWMVAGPVSLASVWQAQLDFAYYKPAITGVLTVAVSTDYDPVGRMGTFTGKSLTTTVGWATNTLDLSPYAGQTVYVAFQYQSASGGMIADGPFVDDVHLRAGYRVFLPIISRWTLTLSKSVSAAFVRPGDTLVYSITVRNTSSPAATGVVVTDTLPTNTTFVSADGGGVYDSFSRTVTWSDRTVPANDNLVLHMTVAIPTSFPAGTQFVNSQYAVSAPPNPTILFGAPVTTSTAFDYVDDFSNLSSGWFEGTYTPPPPLNPCHPPGLWRAGYYAGGYAVNTVCAWNGQLFPAPVRIADPANFTLEVDLRSNQDALWYSSYGVFFNASEDLRETYIVRLFQGEDPPQWAAYYWPNFQGSSDDQPPPQFIMPLENGELPRCYSCNGLDFAWNKLVIRRQGRYIEIWMGSPGNVARQAVLDDNRLVNMSHVRVGLHHANFEWRGDASGYYAYVFDNFKLSPAIR